MTFLLTIGILLLLGVFGRWLIKEAIKIAEVGYNPTGSFGSLRYNGFHNLSIGDSIQVVTEYMIGNGYMTAGEIAHELEKVKHGLPSLLLAIRKDPMENDGIVNIVLDCSVKTGRLNSIHLEMHPDTDINKVGHLISVKLGDPNLSLPYLIKWKRRNKCVTLMKDTGTKETLVMIFEE